jgi:hypothetical protein
MTAALPVVDAATFHDRDLPDLLAGTHGILASTAARDLGPLVLRVGERSWTYQVVDDVLVVEEGAVEAPFVVATMDEGTFSDLATSLRTVLPLAIAGDVVLEAGSIDRLGRWEVALRALYLGIPAFDPEAVDLRGPDGTPLDLAARFTLDDDDATMRDWLAATGFLHLTGVLGEDEVATLAAEVERLDAAATEDDPDAWWATRPDGSTVLCRIVYAHTKSDVVRDLATDPRMVRIADLAGHRVEAFLDRMHGPSLILKPAGELDGLANLPWHQDCWFGAHPITCPSVTLGIQITGSTSQTSRLEVIPGSNGRSVSPVLRPADIAAWPRVAVESQPGDVTVHLDDTLHASPPPDGDGGRVTLYLRFFPDSLGDVMAPGEDVALMLRRRNEARAMHAAGPTTLSGAAAPPA